MNIKARQIKALADHKAFVAWLDDSIDAVLAAQLEQVIEEHVAYDMGFVRLKFPPPRLLLPEKTDER